MNIQQVIQPPLVPKRPHSSLPEGELTTEQDDGTSFKLTAGMTYIVSDELSSHRSVAEDNVKLLIIDGDFLAYQP